MTKHLFFAATFVLATLLTWFSAGYTQNSEPQIAQAAVSLKSQGPANAETEAEKAKTTEPKRETTAVIIPPARWAEAITENKRLASELSWAFGGKQQTGWELYAPLIAQTLAEAEYEPTQAEFAEAVARWQQSVGLGTSSGVIDRASWFRLIQYFQARRIKDRREPSPNEVVMIPVEECFDESRPENLRQAERETYAAYKRMLAAAMADPEVSKYLGPDSKYLKVISAYRSSAYQAELWRRQPNVTRAGLAKNSPHRTGRALDIYVGGEPVSTADHNRKIQVETPVYRWLVKNAGRFGFQPYFYEPWHWEYNPQANN